MPTLQLGGFYLKQEMSNALPQLAQTELGHLDKERLEELKQQILEMWVHERHRKYIRRGGKFDPS